MKSYHGLVHYDCSRLVYQIVIFLCFRSNIMFVSILFIIYLSFGVLFCDTSQKEEFIQNGNLTESNNGQIKLIQDLLSLIPSNRNIIFISPSPTISQILTESWIMENLPLIPFTCLDSSVFAENNEKRISKMQLHNGNKESFYIIIPTEDSEHEDIIQRIKEIQLLDHRSKIAVIHSVPTIGITTYQNIFDVYLFVARANDLKEDVYFMYDTCRFCQDGKSSIKNVNIWHNSTGFQYPFKLNPSFDGNFYGNNVIFQVEDHETGIMVARYPNGTYFAVLGQLIKDYGMIARMLNFTIQWTKLQKLELTFRRVLDPSPKNNRKSNVLDELLNGKVDIVGGGYIASYSAFQLADMSAVTFYQPGANIVSVEPLKVLNWYAIFSTFTPIGWLMIVMSVPVCGYALYFLRKYSENPDKKADLSTSIWDCTEIICWENIRAPHPPASVCIHLSIYMFTTLTLISAYLGSFTSLIVVLHYVKPPIQSSDQLWGETNMKWVSGRMIKYYRNYFSYVPDLEERLISMEKVPPFLDEVNVAIQTLLSRPDDYVLFESIDYVHWAVKDKKIDLNGRTFYHSQETLGDYNTYLYINKTCYFKEYLNRNIQLLHDMGIIRMLNLFGDRGVESGYAAPKEIVSTLITLRHFQGGFIVLLVGYMMGLFSLIYELISRQKIYEDIVPLPKITDVKAISGSEPNLVYVAAGEDSANENPGENSEGIPQS